MAVSILLCRAGTTGGILEILVNFPLDIRNYTTGCTSGQNWNKNDYSIAQMMIITHNCDEIYLI